jgi:iron-sulfur cluster insertion protein
MLSSFSFSRFASQAFNITPAAAQQVKRLLEGDFENKMMRIGLKSGGCAGMQYAFDFESKAGKGDHVFEKDGAQVVLNDHALLYIRGGTLDFVTDKFNSNFKVVLPESTSFHSCNCGKSVGVEVGQHKCG